MPWKRRTTPLTASPTTEDFEGAASRLANAARVVVDDGPRHEVFCEQAALRLAEMAQQVELLRQGILRFESTETWRAVYEAVLSSCQQRRYLSSALIGTEDYWRDRPGRVSLEFNYRLVAHGFHVARVLIIDDFFWPARSELPDKQLLVWAKDQRANGVVVSLVRTSEVEAELRTDFGVYGEVAAGYQVLDEQGRTERFMLKFDKASRSRAEDHWRQLELFATPLEDLIEVRAN